MLSEIFNKSSQNPAIEVEEKYLVKRQADLDNIIKYCIGTFTLDQNYYKDRNNQNYYLKSKIVGTLLSNPISWYYDVPGLLLKDHAAQIRIRSSSTNGKSFHEIAIKGFDQEIDGITVRHEEEFEIDTPELDFSVFETYKSKQFIGGLSVVGITEKNLVKIFATDVDRLMFLIHHRDIPIEIAFDKIKYIDPNGKKLAEQFEIELEYKGDGSHSAYQIRTAFTEIKTEMDKSKVKLIPSKKSKGARGYDFLPKGDIKDLTFYERYDII